jgi:hypothetical protein
MWGYNTPTQDLSWGNAFKKYLAGGGASNAKTPASYGVYQGTPWSRRQSTYGSNYNSNYDGGSPFFMGGNANAKYASNSPENVPLFSFVRRLFKAKLIKCIHHQMRCRKNVEESIRSKIKFLKDIKAYKLNLKQRFQGGVSPKHRAEIIAKLTILKWHLECLKIKKFEKLMALRTLDDSITLKEKLLASLG